MTETASSAGVHRHILRKILTDTHKLMGQSHSGIEENHDSSSYNYRTKHAFDQGKLQHHLINSGWTMKNKNKAFGRHYMKGRMTLFVSKHAMSIHHPKGEEAAVEKTPRDHFVDHAAHIAKKKVEHHGIDYDHKDLPRAVHQTMMSMALEHDNPNAQRQKQFYPKKFDKKLYDNGEHNSFDSEWFKNNDAKMHTIVKQGIAKAKKGHGAETAFFKPKNLLKPRKTANSDTHIVLNAHGFKQSKRDKHTYEHPSGHFVAVHPHGETIVHSTPDAKIHKYHGAKELWHGLRNNHKEIAKVMAFTLTEEAGLKPKLLQTYTDKHRVAKVYHDKDWGEHRVKFYEHGKHLPNADYHTHDRDDAHTTAKDWLRGVHSKSEEATMKETSDETASSAHRSKMNKIAKHRREKWQKNNLKSRLPKVLKIMSTEADHHRHNTATRNKKPVLAQVEEVAKPFDHDRYNWHTFKGQRGVTLHYRGKPHTMLRSGMRFATRHSSNGQHTRLITEHNGKNIVHTISHEHAERLVGRSRPVRSDAKVRLATKPPETKPKVTHKVAPKPPTVKQMIKRHKAKSHSEAVKKPVAHEIKPGKVRNLK